MIKNILIIIVFFTLVFSCGKKGDPEYRDPKQKAEKIIILKNKA